jgi:hypothetical protein
MYTTAVLLNSTIYTARCDLHNVKTMFESWRLSPVPRGHKAEQRSEKPVCQPIRHKHVTPEW